MISFLFWNLRGNQTDTWAERAVHLRRRIGRMAANFGADVFLFAESGFEPGDVIAALTQSQPGAWTLPENPNHRIQIITKLAPKSIVSQYDSIDGRLTIRRCRFGSTDILLAALHFQSQLNWTEKDQAMEATVLYHDIVRAENKVKHQRTVLVGDLNMNPFDPGMVGSHAFNAVMTTEIAEKEERTIAGREYRFFYNPMWGFFGDRTPGPAGTYYHSASKPINYYWNMFDQILLRPELIGLLDEVRILDSDGQESLLTRHGRPRSGDVSDHLPILFRLRI
jgi:hypothetical protein